MRGDAPQLKTLFWEATLRCNAGCRFCGSRCDATSAPEVDGHVVVRAFESVARAFDPHKIMVNVTGGEPLLRRDLFDVMEAVHDLGFPWGMVTNASLIDDEAIWNMKRTGMRTISVSIDGLDEVHERTRRLPGAFPRITEAIGKLAQEAFLDTIQITTIVTKENIQGLDDMLKYFSSLPVDSWRVGLVDPIGRCKDQPGLLLDADDLQRYFSFMDRHRFNAKPVIVTSCSHFLGERDTLYRTHPFSCEAGRSVTSILADGSIFVCPNVPRNDGLIQGNILDDDLAEVWESGFEWFRDDASRKTGDCAHCTDWERCMGDSLHTWDFDARQPSFCIRHFVPSPQANARELASLPRPADQRCGLKTVRLTYGSSSCRVVRFGPQASQELYDYFHWGQVHPANVCEQMVAAAGWFCGEQAWVEELIPVPLLERDQETARVPGDMHDYVADEIAVMNRSMALCSGYDAPFQFLGYVHSHPGALSATMSLPDLEFASWLNEREGHDCFAGIINPQRKDLCVYWDSMFSPNRVELIVEERAVESWL